MEELARHNSEFREATTIGGIAMERKRVAEVAISGETMRTVMTSHRGLNHHEVPLFEIRDTLTDSRNNADGLVSQNHRHRCSG